MPRRLPWRFDARAASRIPRARVRTAMWSAVSRSCISLSRSWAAVPLTSMVTGGVRASIVVCGVLLAVVVSRSILRVPSGEDAGHEVEDVGGADLAVAVVADHAV